MTGIEAMQKTMKVDIYEMAGDIMARHEVEIAEYNRQQLKKGLNRFGKPLTPKISEDPYFKTAAAARAYADWKKRQFPDLPYDTPNLFINGYYHSTITVDRKGNTLEFQASASFADAITAKYKDSALGLTADSEHDVYIDLVREPLLQQVSDATGFKIGNK